MKRGAVRREWDSRDLPGGVADDLAAEEEDPKRETLIDWIVWLLLWPAVTIAWLVTIPFVLVYLLIGVTLDHVHGIELPRSKRRDRDGGR